VLRYVEQVSTLLIASILTKSRGPWATVRATKSNQLGAGHWRRMTSRSARLQCITQDQLVAGLQSYVAAASACVRRDPVSTQGDLEQLKNLGAVLAALEKMAARQREIAAEVIRSLLVDHLVVAIRDQERVAKGKRRQAVATAKRKVRASQAGGATSAPESLPAKLSQDWYAHEYFFADPDPLVAGLRLGYWNYTLLTANIGDNLPLARARTLSAEARRLRTTNPSLKRSKFRANAVAEVLVHDLLDSPGYVASLLSRSAMHLEAAMATAGQTAVRRLRLRHPDRGGAADLVADACYFGAHRTAEGSVNPAGFQPSAEPTTGAAIEFLADCFGGGDAAILALASILNPQQRLWMAAALGGH
jgi:hypothetical protein